VHSRGHSKPPSVNPSLCLQLTVWPDLTKVRRLDDEARIKERAPVAQGAQGKPPFTASSRGNNDRAVLAHEEAAPKTLTKGCWRGVNSSPHYIEQCSPAIAAS